MAESGVDSARKAFAMSRRTHIGLIAFATIALQITIKVDGGVGAAEPSVEASKLVGRFFCVSEGRLGSLSMDGKDWQWHSAEWKVGDADLFPFWQRVSPDGSQIAYGIITDHGPGILPAEATALHLRGLDPVKAALDTKKLAARWCWSADGKQLACSSVERPRGEPEMRHWIIDVPTLKVAELDLPPDRVICDWSVDGEWFLSESSHYVAPVRDSIQLVKRDGTEVRTLSDPKEHAVAGRFSPDGRRVLLTTFDYRDRTSALYVVELAGEKRRQKVSADFFAQVSGASWSPDGKHIGAIWRMKYVNPIKEQKAEYTIVVTDADGRNSTVIRSATGKMPADESAAHALSSITMSALDWR
jgi:Tol biopolymer transport system component